FHGTADTVTPPTDAKAMQAALEKAGVNARLTLIPGAGHDISRVYHGADLYTWFLQHRRAR
ncbi:MAG: prolyl oligopeptidase family serine peptidase, partial [Gemmatimonadota bacterium]